MICKVGLERGKKSAPLVVLYIEKMYSSILYMSKKRLKQNCVSHITNAPDLFWKAAFNKRKKIGGKRQEQMVTT